MKVEENALVLDFLPRGKSASYKPEPVAQVIGMDYFTLLEIVPKEGVEFKAMEKVYVGKGERDKVEYIKRRIKFSELTSNALSEIEKTIESLIKGNEKKYVDFFNNASPITIKRHQIELLPGLGKKHVFSILEQREKEHFKSFEDISKRVKLMPNVVNTLVKRIVEELESEEEKHYIFARPPSHGEDRPREFRK
ncbi:MAG: DUF655 domain-containing protein [Candidatus Diapherotrites archaeon]